MIGCGRIFFFIVVGVELAEVVFVTWIVFLVLFVLLFLELLLLFDELLDGLDAELLNVLLGVIVTVRAGTTVDGAAVVTEGTIDDEFDKEFFSLEARYFS